MTDLVVDVVGPGCGHDLRPAMHALRHEVFVVGQGVPPELELDAHDATACHVVARVGGAVVGTGRFVAVPPAGTVKVGRMAVADSARGRGVGAAVLARLEVEAAASGAAQVVLHAQRSAEGFYERAGYAVDGEPFDEAGIAHIAMRKALLAPSADR